MLNVEALEDRSNPSNFYQPTESVAFLNPTNPGELDVVRTYPGEGMGGRLTVRTDVGGRVLYDGFPFGDQARFGGAAVVIPGIGADPDKLAFYFPNPGAGPRVGILEVQGSELVFTASYFALPALYRGGIQMQAVSYGGRPYELACLAGAMGGPVLSMMGLDGSIRIQILVGPADDRAGGYELTPTGGAVTSPVSGEWCIPIGYKYQPGDPPRYQWVHEFDLNTGQDRSSEFDILNDGIRID